MFLLSPQSQRLCGDPRNKEYSRTLSQHNKKAIRYKYLMTFLVRCRSRHSVSKGPPDLSPKFFRFAQNLDTRVRVPTTRNNKNSEADKYLLRYFGTLEGTRTPDLLVRSQSLYPAELPARICVALFVLQ